jgi:hypothetical protein
MKISLMVALKIELKSHHLKHESYFKITFLEFSVITN